MQERIEQIIGEVYRDWRQKRLPPQEDCPDEETLACFFEGHLPEKESRQVKEHLIGCDRCPELIVLISRQAPEVPLPQELIEVDRQMVMRQEKAQPCFLEIVLGLKEKTVDLIKASGDILFGREFTTLPAIRGRNVNDLGREAVIVKDLGEIRVEVCLENKTNYAVRIRIKLSDVNRAEPVEGLRLTLVRAGCEIESYIAEAGKAVFDNVALGDYAIEISTPESITGRIALEIKKI